jgi:CRISPR-associated endonuclease Cas1
MRETSLLINESFALRQIDGKPVFTSVKAIETPYQKSEIDNIINNLNTKRKVLGLTPTKSFDTQYNEILKKTPKKSREKIDHSIDLHDTHRIIITPNAKGYISTYFLDFMKEHSIPIYWIDEKGIIEASFIPFHLITSSKVIQQCESRLNGKNIEIAKYIIELKLESQEMNKYIPDLKKTNNLRGIIQVEGRTSRGYYKKWGDSLNKEWNFTGRHGRGSSQNSSAIDPINTMLNLGYSILVQQMSENIIKRGFEPSIGFLHFDTKNRYWNMLAFDFIEPFRVWIDNVVTEIINEKVIKPCDFTFTDDKNHMILKDKAFEIVLDRFLNILEPLVYKSLPMIRTVEKMLE